MPLPRNTAKHLFLSGKVSLWLFTCLFLLLFIFFKSHPGLADPLCRPANRSAFYIYIFAEHIENFSTNLVFQK